MRAWGENDDGKPVYLLNLMQFFDGPTTGTPGEANAYYEDAIKSKLLKSGAYPRVAGSKNRTRGNEMPESNLMVYNSGLDNWDRILMVRYPCRRTFLQLVTHPDYLKVIPYQASLLEVILKPSPASW